MPVFVTRPCFGLPEQQLRLTIPVIGTNVFRSDWSKFSLINRFRQRGMEQQRFSFFQALVMSFYSPRLYRDVYWRWQRSGLFYTLQMATAIVALFLTFILFFVVRLNPDPVIRSASTWLLGENPATREMAINRFFTILSTLPHLEYQNQTLSTPEPAATVIHDPETHYALFTINTTGKPAAIPYRHMGMYPTITSHTIGLDNEYIPLSAIADEQTIQTILAIINQFPSLTLLDGRLIYTGSNPLVIQDPSGHPLVIIDTNGTSAHAPFDDPSLAVLTDTTIRVRMPSLTNHPVWIEKRWDALSSDTLYHALSRLVSTGRFITACAILLTAPILILCLFSILALVVLLYSVEAWLFTRIVPSLTHISYSRCICLSSVALTPVFLLSIALHPDTLPEGIMLYGAVAGFYLYFALKATSMADT